MLSIQPLPYRRRRKWNGPPQFEDKTGQLMMLNTDMVSPYIFLTKHVQG